jgi:hypothetical protein
MPTNAYYIVANINSGAARPLSLTDSNPRTIQLTAAGAVYMVFGYSTEASASTAMGSSPMLITTNNVVSLLSVDLSTTWVKSQSAATVVVSYTYPTPG